MEDKLDSPGQKPPGALRCSSESLRRYLLVLAFACWFGGFTFYALVVIPTAHHVLGNMREVGFITQQVTNWLNWVGVLWLVIAFWNARVANRSASPAIRRIMRFAWILMAIMQAGLFATHPFMDQLLDPAKRTIQHFARFDRLHDTYETIITTLWVGSLVYLWCAIAEWKERDRGHLHC